MRYVNLMGGQKPHLLVKTDQQPRRRNPRSTTPPRPSSTCRTSATANPGSPGCRFRCMWSSVSRPTTTSAATASSPATPTTMATSTGEEREFRGFGMVEQWDTEQFAALTAAAHCRQGDNIDAASHVPPVHTKTWFHTGAYLGRSRTISVAQFEHEYFRETRPDDAETALRRCCRTRSSLRSEPGRRARSLPRPEGLDAAPGGLRR
jgi:hypothetical protein